MKQIFFIAVFLLFCISLAAQTLQEEAEKFLAQYEFEKAAEGYAAAALATGTDFSLKIRQARTAAEMLQRVEDIAIIDSVVVDKGNLLAACRFDSDLGTLVASRKGDLELIKYVTQRGDRQIFSDTTSEAGLDIFSAYRLLGNWEEATPLSAAINTADNENYPFLMSDGVTLYFAADGERSIGGYDIFVTRFNPEKNEFFPPENLGMPFNSPFNDYMMVLDEAQGIGWFASDRYLPQGKVSLYRFRQNKSKIILRGEHPDTIRARAQLKLLRRDTLVAENILSDIPKTSESVADFSFIINENTVYHSTADFKNPKAAALFLQMEKQRAALQLNRKTLEELRENYATSNQSEREKLAPQILSLEHAIQQQAKELQNSEIQVRYYELEGEQ